MSSTRNRIRCDQCGAATTPKRLTDLGSAGRRCSRCLDHIPSAERRSLLRKAAKEPR